MIIYHLDRPFPFLPPREDAYPTCCSPLRFFYSKKSKIYDRIFSKFLSFKPLHLNLYLPKIERDELFSLEGNDQFRILFRSLLFSRENNGIGSIDRCDDDLTKRERVRFETKKIESRDDARCLSIEASTDTEAVNGADVKS